MCIYIHFFTSVGNLILDFWALDNRKLTQILVAGPSCNAEKGAKNMFIWLCHV